MEILKKYTSTDELRPEMNQILCDGKYLMATNAHIGVRRLPKKGEELPSKSKRYVDSLNRHFNEMPKKGRMIQSSVIIDFLKSYKKHTVRVDKCEECYGEEVHNAFHEGAIVVFFDSFIDPEYIWQIVNTHKEIKWSFSDAAFYASADGYDYIIMSKINYEFSEHKIQLDEFLYQNK